MWQAIRVRINEMEISICDGDARQRSPIGEVAGSFHTQALAVCCGSAQVIETTRQAHARRTLIVINDDRRSPASVPKDVRGFVVGIRRRREFEHHSFMVFGDRVVQRYHGDPGAPGARGDCHSARKCDVIRAVGGGPADVIANGDGVVGRAGAADPPDY